MRSLFTADLSSIARARHWVVEQARAHGAAPHALRTVALLATEAVTNAVVHGPATGSVEVTIDRRGPDLRIGVRDDSDAAPVLRDPPASAPSGRGVLLIDRLSGAWGVQSHPVGGKTVWFDVRCLDGDRPDGAAVAMS